MQRDLTFVISDLGSGGAQRVMTTLANAWAERGLKICVVTMSLADNDFFQLHPRIHRISIGEIANSKNFISAIIANIRRLRALRRALSDAGAATVLAFIGSTNILTILAAERLGLQVTISERNDPKKQSLGRSWDLMRRYVYPRAYLVTANSRGAIETLSKFVPTEKLAYVPNPIPSAVIGKPEARKPIVLNVGRLTYQKGQDILLHAFAKFYLQAPEWRLKIVGDGEEKTRLQCISRDLGIAGHVDWINRVDDPMPLYIESGMFVMPSRFEGTPNALLEAMSTATPVVVSDASSGLIEYVEHNVTGIVVPSGNIDALAEALSNLESNPEVRAELGQAAAERVSRQSVSSVLDEWACLLALPKRALSSEAK